MLIHSAESITNKVQRTTKKHYKIVQLAFIAACSTNSFRYWSLARVFLIPIMFTAKKEKKRKIKILAKISKSLKTKS